MITLFINGEAQKYNGSGEESLLTYLRRDLKINSPKDGCSGEGSCGACTVEVNGKPMLACRSMMKDLDQVNVVTTEGLPSDLKHLLGKMFAKKGAVQCGFCSPGFIMRAKQLFEKKDIPKREEIIKAVNPNICRCTGYIKIVDAIEDSLKIHHQKNNNKKTTDLKQQDARIGKSYPKYQAVETALGNRPFVDDLFFEDMLFGALKFSEHPRAVVKKINTDKALQVKGVRKILTAKDIPGTRITGLIFHDWPMMIDKGETTNCIGDVLACVVAETEEQSRIAAELIEVEYEVLEAVTDVHEAAKTGSVQVHSGQSNILETCSITFGNVEKAFNEAAYTSSSVYTTQRIEHAFLEPECAIALPEDGKLRIYSQGQGAYVDRKLIAKILALNEADVLVTQVQNGGGFGGKEDLSVQGHAALCAKLMQKPVKVKLTRQESIRMHPKRHPVWMDMQLACDKKGKLTAIRLKALGDTGAYASVGTKVMERVVGHATGGYTVPAVDISAHTVYTNNIPSGAMRGFGVPQVVFAIESCIDDICRQGNFDRWQFRYNNALANGATTATGQRLEGVGLKDTLLAVKDQFRSAKYAGIACGIKNTGVGNGMIDDSEVIIEIVSDRKVIIHHGWTEMGQGVHTMAIQCLHEETGIDPGIIEVIVDTEAGIPTGMTTSSRATALVGNAIIDTAKRIREALDPKDIDGSLEKLSGRKFKGKYVCDWTCKPGAETDDPKIHFAYGYATQVVILDDEGNISKVIAAHDAGKIMNQMLFEGQIEGAVHMGLGYALSEDLPMKNGQLVSSRFKDLGILRSKKMPKVEVIGIEEKDPYGPYGAKGIGEIGMVPTAAAVANAFYAFDGNKRTKLPINGKVK